MGSSGAGRGVEARARQDGAADRAWPCRVAAIDRPVRLAKNQIVAVDDFRFVDIAQDRFDFLAGAARDAP